MKGHNTMTTEHTAELITTKLFNEALGCPVAFKAFIDQYAELSDTARTEYFDSLSGAQAASFYFASANHAEGIGGLMLMFAGLDTDAANDAGNRAMTRVGEAYGLDSTEEGTEIPEQIKNDAMEYITAVEAAKTPEDAASE